MTNSIAKQLDLGPIEHYYDVEDVRSFKEIQKARFIRQTQGKHVMPIPYRQVEQNFLNDWYKGHGDFFIKARKNRGNNDSAT